MKRITYFAPSALFCALAAHAVPFEAGYTCSFYGGDLDLNDPNQNGLANENDAIVPNQPWSNYGAATYQNFVEGGITVKGLATNNLSGLNPTAAYWEIRSGVSEGNGGILVASGTGSGANFSHTLTSRSDFGYNEYTDFVGGLNIFLSAGTYWFSVVPQDPANANRSFNSNTEGLNAVGTQVNNRSISTRHFSARNSTNANNEGVFQTFSSAVYDDPLAAPEPPSLISFGSGLLAIGAHAPVISLRDAGRMRSHGGLF